MTESSTHLFGSGVHHTVWLRRQLLEALGAEPEWMVGDDHDAQIIWLPGPLPTFLAVEPAGDLTPGLGLLTVRTRCAWVQDLDGARQMVAELNSTTSVNRWSVIGDPGPQGWADPQGPYSPGAATELRQRRLAPPPASGATPSVEVGASFVVGDEATDLPLAVIVQIVREQVAKAVALATNDFHTGWGQPAAVALEDRARDSDAGWNDIVYHFDQTLPAHADADAAAMQQALLDAFHLEQAEQFQSAAAWYGGGDASGFTCEVPYGPGPFPAGLIGMIQERGLEVDDDTRTSLVQASPQRHPHLGNGLLVTLRTPGNCNDDEPWWVPALLNAQNRLTGAGNHAAAEHGLGAWTDRDGSLWHILFVPAAWATALTPEDLRQFFRQVLANAARLSWTARRVLEPHVDLTVEQLVRGASNPPSGLAAGPNARGPEFGEPGVGRDPGARLLGFTYDNLVGIDDRWASLLEDDRAGFTYLPNRHLQQIWTEPCRCHDVGSRVIIDTALATSPDDDAIGQALALQHTGQPSALVRTDDGTQLTARTVLHVHDDSYGWLRSWPPALAVAQALHADQLDADLAGHAQPAHNAHPTLGLRTAPDEMLTLFDPGQDWLTVPGRPLQPDALALAGLFTARPAYRCRWHDGDVVLDWPVSIRYGDDTQVCTVATRYGPYEHPNLGACLRITTPLAIEADDLHARCLELNQEQLDSTQLGGLGIDPHGTVSYTTVVPVPFDRSTDPDAHASFIGTSLGHHTNAVATLLLSVDDVAAPELNFGALTDGVTTLPDFYRQAGLDLDPSLHVTPHPAPGENEPLLAQVTRPWPTPADIREWPRLGAYQPAPATGSGNVIRTQIPLGPPELWADALRLLHGAILGAVKPRHTRTGVAAPLAEATHPLSRGAAGAVLYGLADAGVLTFDEDDGVYRISTDTGLTIPFRLDLDGEHPGWGRATTITATVPSQLLTAAPNNAGQASWVIGDWHETDDGPAFRVCLPPAAFAAGDLTARQTLLYTAVRIVVGHVNNAVQAAPTITPPAHSGHPDQDRTATDE